MPGSQAAATSSFPPTVYTGTAGQLTTASAALKGSVDPRGQQTSYYFQYGENAAYEAQSPLTPVGAGTQTIHVSVSIAGLLAGTTYHYRLVAVNASGTVDGLDQTFTTRKIPLTFTLAAVPSPDVFGTPFSVTGTLSGTGSASQAVELQVNPFPYLGGFKVVGNPELTNADGSFSFAVAPPQQTAQLRIVALTTPPANSKVLVERVAVRVTLQLRPTGRHGFARLYGTVTPAEVGAQVRFQLLRPGRKLLNVGATLVRHRSSTVSEFSRVLHIRRAGLYRAFVRIVSGAQESGQSRVILIR